MGAWTCSAPAPNAASHACHVCVSCRLSFHAPGHLATLQCRSALAGRGFELPIARKKQAAAARKLKRKPTRHPRSKAAEVRCLHPCADTVPQTVGPVWGVAAVTTH